MTNILAIIASVIIMFISQTQNLWWVWLLFLVSFKLMWWVSEGIHEAAEQIERQEKIIEMDDEFNLTREERE